MTDTLVMLGIYAAFFVINVFATLIALIIYNKLLKVGSGYQAKSTPKERTQPTSGTGCCTKSEINPPENKKRAGCQGSSS